MSVHVCKCTHNGRDEWHLRYPGMSEEAAQRLADKINAGTPLQGAGCLLCAEGNDLPRGEWCRSCGRSNETPLARAVRLARGSDTPPAMPLTFADTADPIPSQG